MHECVSEAFHHKLEKFFTSLLFLNLIIILNYFPKSI